MGIRIFFLCATFTYSVITRVIGPTQMKQVQINHRSIIGPYLGEQDYGPFGFRSFSITPFSVHKRNRRIRVKTEAIAPILIADPQDITGGGLFTAIDGTHYTFSETDLIGGGHFSKVFKAYEVGNRSHIIAVKRRLWKLPFGDERGALIAQGIFFGEDEKNSLIGLPFYEGQTLKFFFSQKHTEKEKKYTI